MHSAPKTLPPAPEQLEAEALDETWDDLCHAAGAVVYCYNDSAHLCKACDVR